MMRMRMVHLVFGCGRCREAAGADLEGLLRDEYGVTRPEELTVPQASRVIDLLKTTADA